MNFRFSDLWDWHGTVGRGKYLTLGFVQFALKHNSDASTGACSTTSKISLRSSHARLLRGL